VQRAVCDVGKFAAVSIGAMVFVYGVTLPQYSHAQQTEIRFYGHQNVGLYDLTPTSPLGRSSAFTIGEQDLFINSQINDRISFLGETVVKPTLSGSFLPSIERARIKFDYHPRHAIIIGKMHTPVNYWNDVYHHGRLFYPTIDRPDFFDLVVPIHTLGIRFQGQNLGKLKFGYDVLVGNGISSTDVSDMSQQKSLTIAGHIRPKRHMRIGASYYHDVLEGNRAGSHSGHSTGLHPEAMRYQGNVEYNMFSFSFASFGERNEVLIEAALNFSHTDSLGRAENTLGFMYLGRRITEKKVLYSIVDYTHIGPEDLHIVPQHLIKFGLGIKHEFSPLVVLKIELDRSTTVKMAHGHSTPNHHSSIPNQNNLVVQIAYGF
jgi:hypothetical protein